MDTTFAQHRIPLLRPSQWTRSTAVLLLTPLTAFYLMQFVYNGAPFYSLGVLLANYLCLAALFFPLYALTGRAVGCSVAVHGAAALWGAANFFVVQFRNSPVLPWDFTALDTAMAVAGRYSLTPSMRMGIALAFVILLAVFLPRWLRGGKHPIVPGGRRQRIALGIFGLLCLFTAVSPTILEKLGATTDVWNPSSSYRDHGAAATFFANMKFLSVEVPTDYSPDQVSMVDAKLPAGADGAASGVVRPNVIAIMSESWADFEEYGNLNLTESVSDYMRSLDAIHGHAYTSVFGGGTSTSEFEFLTGNSMAFLPSGSTPYQQYILSDTDSLASRLKDEGYRTLAMHPGEETSWQRNRAYPLLGFDSFQCGEVFDVPITEVHGYISDETNFRQILHAFETKETDERLFLFDVTIQNHGGYTDPDYPTTVQLTDYPGQFPKAEQYLSLVNQSDQDLKLLIDYFQDYEEPTILIMFGDHPPAVEQEFLDLAYGVSQDDMTMEQYMAKYRVPFFIWANYELPDLEIAHTSLNFLGQTLLELAGFQPSRYGQFLQQVQESLSAVTFVGYMDTETNAYSYWEDTPFEDLLYNYSVVQYNNLFGGSDRDNVFFSSPSQMTQGISAGKGESST